MNLSASNEVGMSVALFFGILVCLEIGFRIGLASSKRNHELAYEGTGTIDAAVFALLGLLLGFSFAGAMSRFDARRQLIVNEANTIGTAISASTSFPQPISRNFARFSASISMRVSGLLRSLEIGVRLGRNSRALAKFSSRSGRALWLPARTTRPKIPHGC
jgi:hypothetical protein